MTHTPGCAGVRRQHLTWPQPQLEPQEAEAVLACPHPGHDAWKFVVHRIPLPNRRTKTT